MWNIIKIISKGDYNYALVPDHPNSTKNGYVLEHRVIVENVLNRLLDRDEIIHHKNKNKKDNRIENLEVMNLRDHARLHGLQQGVSMVEFCCPYCKTIFSKTKRRTIDQKSRNKPNKLYFCNKSCSSKYQFDKNRIENIKQSENILRFYRYAGEAQLDEQGVSTAEVKGSNPLPCASYGLMVKSDITNLS